MSGVVCPARTAASTACSIRPAASVLPIVSRSKAAESIAPIGFATFLPANCGAVIRPDSWPLPPLFRLVQQLATGMDQEQLLRTLNMGIGMVVIVGPDEVADIRRLIREPTWVIGAVTDGPHQVTLI